ncbi:unnamed protein product [Strongylus vulgaris]|uniref:Uncharacterized protein n=1 Tax=Strongylus vulgaris TaxID=40348 RepID=A0A3P7LIM3_STRVU|nr:unnamed protein product [Strongylus vulgaris]
MSNIKRGDKIVVIVSDSSRSSVQCVQCFLHEVEEEEEWTAENEEMMDHTQGVELSIRDRFIRTHALTSLTCTQCAYKKNLFNEMSLSRRLIYAVYAVCGEQLWAIYGLLLYAGGSERALSIEANPLANRIGSL